MNIRSVLALICLCLGSHSVMAQDSAAKREARIAVQGLRRSYDQTRIEKLDLEKLAQSKFEAELKDNRAAHVERVASEKLLHQHAEAIARNLRRKTIEATIASVAKSKDVTFSEEEISDLLASSETTDAAFSRLLNAKFPALAATVRKTAVAEQWEGIKASVYPTAAEVESIFADSKLQTGVEARLLQEMKKLLAEPVFEENETRMGKELIEPAIEDGLAQLRTQLGTVAKSAGGKERLPELAEAVILSEIEAVRLKLQAAKLQTPSEPQKTFGLFPSVKNRASERGLQLAVDLFAADAAQRSYKPQADDAKQWQASLKRFVLSELAKHAQRSASWEIVEEKVWSFTTDRIHKDYEASIPAAAQQKVGVDAAKEFFKKLRAMTTPQGVLSKTVQTVIEASFRETFDAARAEVALTQVADHFSPLDTDTWKPSEQLIESSQAIGVVRVAEPMKLPGVSQGSKPYKAEELLEETPRKVRELVVAAISEGVSALSLQLKLVRDPDGLKPLRTWAAKNTDSHATARAYLVGVITRQVLKSWGEEKLATRYPDLFARTKKEIELQADALLPKGNPDIAKQNPKSSDMGPGKEGTGQGNGKGGDGGPFSGSWSFEKGEQDESYPDVFIYIRHIPDAKNGDQVEFISIFGKPAGKHVWRFAAKDFEDSDQVITRNPKSAAISKQILAEMRDVVTDPRIARGDEITVVAYAWVDQLVPFGAVSMLQNLCSSAAFRLKNEGTARGPIQFQWLSQPRKPGDSTPREHLKRKPKIRQKARSMIVHTMPRIRDRRTGYCFA